VGVGDEGQCWVHGSRGPLACPVSQGGSGSVERLPAAERDVRQPHRGGADGVSSASDSMWTTGHGGWGWGGDGCIEGVRVWEACGGVRVCVAWMLITAKVRFSLFIGLHRSGLILIRFCLFVQAKARGQRHGGRTWLSDSDNMTAQAT
jgi:hypothetical protein